MPYRDTAARRFPRFDFAAPMAVLIERPGESIRLKGQCRQLGEGGLGAVLPLDLEPNQRVLVEVYVEALTTIRAPARVTHRRGSVHGFEFVRERAVRTDA